MAEAEFRYSASCFASETIQFRTSEHLRAEFAERPFHALGRIGRRAEAASLVLRSAPSPSSVRLPARRSYLACEASSTSSESRELPLWHRTAATGLDRYESPIPQPRLSTSAPNAQQCPSLSRAHPDYP